MASDTLNHALTMWDVAGELDAAAMESAFLRVLDEAEVLRVNFVDEGEGLRLVPRELGDWRPFFLDLSDAPDPEQAAREALTDLVRRPFDLARDLLFRLGTVKLAADRSLLVIAYHHVIADGFGAGGLLSRRLAEVYTALVQGQDVAQLPHSWDVGSFAAMSTQYLASEKSGEDIEFWRDYLKEALPAAQIPQVVVPEAMHDELTAPMSDADRWAEVAGAIGMSARTLTVPRAEADAWTAAAASMGVWMSTMLTTATAAFLRHRCDLPEFLLSLATGNRAGAAGTTPGLAVNVVPVRIRVPLGATVAELADAIVDETFEVAGHTLCHYSEIQRASGTAPSERGSFGAVVNVIEFVDQLHFGGHPARYSGATTGSFNELSIGVYTDGTADSDLFIRLDAPASLYSRAQLRLIGEDLIAYVRAVVADAGRPIGALDVLGGAERARLLATPDRTLAPGSTIPELFAQQVARDPAAVAIVSGDSAISYRALDERSSRLAAALRRRRIGPETVVAVAMPRSVDLAVALLGVVKAGGAYLPIDPGLPAEKIETRARAAGAQALLVEIATAAQLPADAQLPAIVYEDLRLDNTGDTGEPAPLHPGNALAVTYGCDPADAITGVVVTHRNLARYVLDRHWPQEGPGTVLWHTSAAGDALALELWLPLLRGGQVVVAAQEELDGDALVALRADHRISLAWLPAGVLSAVAAQRPDALVGLSEVWTGADQVPRAALQRIREACPGLSIVNGHGPVDTTALIPARGWAADEQAPDAAAGGLTDGTARYVLGPGLAPVPAGVAGELYVAGPAVARGYAGLPLHTAQRFVACPFGPAGAVMYRTGDRVRWGADGRLEYVGRAGARPRIRGVEVDTGHVEEALSAHPRLAQSLVVVREDGAGQQRLVAYVVPVPGSGAADAGAPDPRAELSHEELSRFAAARVQESLLPSAFVVLDRLPVTAGGRVDRSRLPEPKLPDGRYRAPRNRTEQVLAKLFAEVLELGRVGIDEDFFDLGGNSLRAIRLVGLIRAELKLEVSIRTLFAARTIAGLSERRENLAQSSRPALRRRTKGGAVV
ncbi:nonribosomal peptide synthetase DhbF [Couchioplanes caeruleus]|uniref:Nonribosomal peptide synthetase DhbF n=2 Tax=Couchioplanes caeruleus TaxID=56438 RepID=A0A3N1GM75_9ACTN|nr:nonribosomal peptide synthetase DhbF [Couchioplanes caeruleus]